MVGAVLNDPTRYRWVNQNQTVRQEIDGGYLWSPKRNLELLNEVRLRGDWERWLDFFAEGIEVSSTQAVTTANILLALVNADRDRITRLGRAVPSALAVHLALQRQPIATAASLVKTTGLTAATVNKSLVHLERIGVVGELTNRQRGRVFSHGKYMQELAAEM